MNTCVCCGFPVPEGRQVCPGCETWSAAADAYLPDGTPLYLKTPTKTPHNNLQFELYEQFMGYKRAMSKED